MLTVENLNKSFGNLRAIDGVGFSISENEIVSLIGSNGAGKTTLVNLLSGYIRPDSGKIHFLEEDITSASPYMRIKLGIGRSFQLVQLFEESKVLDNVRTPLFSKNGKIKSLFIPSDKYVDIKKNTLEILKVFNLSHKEDILAKELSEGDKKVLDIAMAYALRTKLLLLDEPTSGVATQDKFKVMDTIVYAIRNEKISALIVEHDMDIVAKYSDRVIVMHEGKIIVEGKPDVVMSHKDVREHILGLSENVTEN